MGTIQVFPLKFNEEDQYFWSINYVGSSQKFFRIITYNLNCVSRCSIPNESAQKYAYSRILKDKHAIHCTETEEAGKFSWNWK